MAGLSRLVSESSNRPRTTLPRITAVSSWRVRGTPDWIQRLDEPPHEVEGDLGDLAPAAVDCQRVAAVRDLLDLSHRLVAALALVGGIRDRPWHRVVLLAVDDQKRAAVRVADVELRLAERVQVGVGHLHQR